MQMQLDRINYIQSPLNYTGGKFKLLPQILPLFPKEINCFVDLFCGGCNVGINVKSKSVVYNDLDEHLLYLYNTFKNLDKDAIKRHKTNKSCSYPPFWGGLGRGFYKTN